MSLIVTKMGLREKQFKARWGSDHKRIRSCFERLRKDGYSSYSRPVDALALIVHRSANSCRQSLG